ncbi:MAG TPA: hypothetical protein VM754_02625 [Actinomycetota bacterium]|nr:hypothetical protein [Actinomycetota bacterium]
MGDGTWLDVQEAAQAAFDAAKEDIDNPVYEVERAWKSGFNNGFKLALNALGIPEQEALDKMHELGQDQDVGRGPSLGG